jgi:hypothetical protein
MHFLKSLFSYLFTDHPLSQKRVLPSYGGWRMSDYDILTKCLHYPSKEAEEMVARMGSGTGSETTNV